MKRNRCLSPKSLLVDWCFGSPKKSLPLLAILYSDYRVGVFEQMESSPTTEHPSYLWFLPRFITLGEFDQYLRKKGYKLKYLTKGYLGWTEATVEERVESFLETETTP